MALDGNVIRKRNRSVLIRPRAPSLPVGDGLAPNLPPADQRPAIIHGDIRKPNPLCNDRPLAQRRKSQLDGLPAILELRPRIPGETAERHRQAPHTK